MSNRKFIRVEESTKRPTDWIIDLESVVRVHPSTGFMVFSDGAALNLTKESMQKLIEELEVIE